MTYKIEILGYEDSKNSGRKTLIENNLIYHSLLRELPVSVRYFYIALRLITGDMQNSNLELSERTLRDLLESSWSVSRALDALQSIQLLTYTQTLKITPPLEKKKIKAESKLKQITTPEELSDEIGPDGRARLLELFDVEHIDQEFPLMAAWLHSNKKQKKNYLMFVINWLKRSRAEYEAGKRTRITYNESMRIR